MAYRVTIPGAKEADEGRSAGMGGSPTGEEVVIPVMMVTEKSPSPLLERVERPPTEWERPPGRWSVIVGRTVVDLDPAAVRELLGPGADDHDLAILKFDIAEALARYLSGIRDGQLPPRQLVRGLPLADLLNLADVAALLRAGARQ